MITITVGYSGTGSSAVTHLLSEYLNYTTAGLETYEHLPLYTPNGLFDLEDRILRGNYIHGSDAAIDLFYNEMKRLNDNDFGWFGGYKKRYGKKFMEIVDQLIDDIVEFNIPGHWSYDHVKENSFPVKVFTKIRNMLFQKTSSARSRIKKDNNIYYSFINAEQFYFAAKKFIKGYIDMINQDSNKNLILDQFLLPQNLHRIPHYFDNDIRIIVVERDPRDMYVLSKYIWPKMGYKRLFPDNTQDFIQFYKGLYRIERKINDSRILRVRFEDLIYNYDATLPNMEQFLGVADGQHTKKGKKFNPKVSISNTQNFLIREDWAREVLPIQKEMKDKLYNFPYSFKPKLEDVTDP